MGNAVPLEAGANHYLSRLPCGLAPCMPRPCVFAPTFSFPPCCVASLHAVILRPSRRRGRRRRARCSCGRCFATGWKPACAGAAEEFFDADEGGLRLFETRLDRVEAQGVADAIARERRFDSDLWVVCVETDDLGDLIDFTGAEPKDDGFFGVNPAGSEGQ